MKNTILTIQKRLKRCMIEATSIDLADLAKNSEPKNLSKLRRAQNLGAFQALIQGKHSCNAFFLRKSIKP